MKIILNANITEYLSLKNQGYKTLWAGNGLICLIEDLAKKQ